MLIWGTNFIVHCVFITYSTPKRHLIILFTIVQLCGSLYYRFRSNISQCSCSPIINLIHGHAYNPRAHSHHYKWQKICIYSVGMGTAKSNETMYRNGHNHNEIQIRFGIFFFLILQLHIVHWSLGLIKAHRPIDKLPCMIRPNLGSLGILYVLPYV